MFRIHCAQSLKVSAHIYGYAAQRFAVECNFRSQYLRSLQLRSEKRKNEQGDISIIRKTDHKEDKLHIYLRQNTERFSPKAESFRTF